MDWLLAHWVAELDAAEAKLRTTAPIEAYVKVG